eukprot:TRINITY_DN51797_c0_g1_i1.p1 TRINITY_DN51797_c0_g1~~TRINITY_DN51797_c0_g1_i1.p1  ORF type:complete len:509 (+),score=27.86 TRINITY_DN51797_c0_g1_i1:74-1600(+)
MSHSSSRAAPPNACKKLSQASGAGHQRPPGGGAGSPFPPPSAHYCDIPADFSKVDSILRHLQQTESHDWLGEISHCCTQVCYLLLQNYNISRLNFYNWNFHLIVLTSLFFAQRIWFYLWRVTHFTDAHGVRFACHIVLFMVLLDALYCSMQLVLKDSILGGLFLIFPLLCSVAFYQWYLKANTNVFTAELFGMLGRCVYHSMETAYCVGVLPLRFLQYECIYYDTSRCIVLTMFVTAHSFLSFLCLELHCLGSEVLQQSRMLGDWRCITDLARLKSLKASSEWSSHNCPYSRGTVVKCKGRYYEATAPLNTCTPTSPSQCIVAIAAILGDSQRAKALMLTALLVLNAALVNFVLWSNQWSLYAAMLLPNCCHFLYVKFRKTHSFFNPAHLNLRKLQWDLNVERPGRPPPAIHRPAKNGNMNGAGSCRERLPDKGAEGHTNGPCAGHHHADAALSEAGVSAPVPSGNPLFMSAVSASTMFFFGPSESARSSEGGNNSAGGGQRHDDRGG